MQLYLDANVIIYSVEQLPEYVGPIGEWVARVEGARGRLITSNLSRLECRVGPLRRRDEALRTRFDEFFEGADLTVLDLGRDVLDRATELRATYGFRTPDALHLATAILIEADVFLTADVRLARCTDVRV